LPGHGSQVFSVTNRLRNSREFSRIWREGQRCHTRSLTVIASSPATLDQNWSRLGVTVSRKVGNAVCRNRIKRWIREYFRSSRHRLARAIDLSVIAKPGAAHLDHGDFDRELQEGMQRLRLYLDA